MNNDGQRGFVRRIAIAAAILLIAALTTAGDWPTYMHDPQHTGASLDETTLSTANVPTLVKLWSYKTTGYVAGAPTIVNGIAYFGSYDGYEYAVDAASGALKWKTFLGTSGFGNGGCKVQGIQSTATVQNGTVYVGGGANDWYALDASTGAVKWSLFIGDSSSSGGNYNWSSPLVVNGYAYIGTASRCDQPLVQGRLLKVDLSDTSPTAHQVVATFNVVPNGKVGGSIWSSPAYDPETNSIFITTGNDHADPPVNPLTVSMISVDATTLALKGSWQVPAAQLVPDPDWTGTSPIVFDSGGLKLVAAMNKSGYLYTFDRTNISAGPLWEQVLAIGGPDPYSGDASSAPGAFANGTLYMEAYNTTINGTSFQGSVRAFDPATGAIKWEHGVPGVLFGSLVYANGFIVDAFTNYVEVLDASSGSRLFGANLGTNVQPYSVALANGRIYVGSNDNNLTAFGLPSSSPTATPTALPDANCPAGWSCRDIGSPALHGSDALSNGDQTITGAGTGAGGSSDQFRFLAQPLSGDGQLSAALLSQGTGSADQAGLMVRTSMDPGAPFYDAVLRAGSGVVVSYRGTSGSSVVTLPTPSGVVSLPQYLAVQRRGDQVVTASSPDGTTWTLVPGSQATVILPGTSWWGLAVSSGSSSSGNTASFRGITSGPVGGSAATPSPVPVSGCVAPWRCGEVGNFSPSGSQALSAGTWTLTGAGQDQGGFWHPGDYNSSYDEFHYVWQSLTGDGSLSAQVTSQSNTNSWAKAGIMLRASTDPTAPYYAVFLTPGHGVAVEYRLLSGYFNRMPASQSGSAGIYLKVQRSGNSFTAYTSSSGTSWTAIGGSTFSISMPSTLLAGMVVTSSAAGVLGQGSFAQVTLTGSLATPTPTNTPTNTPTSTNTPTPTLTATPTKTPSSTPTPTDTPTDTPTPTNTPTLTATPTNTPVGTALSGTQAGSVPAQGASDSYAFDPSGSGPVTVGSCSISTTHVFTVVLLDSSNHVLGSGTNSSYCNWATAMVTAGQTYTVKTTGVSGSGPYRSSWSVNGSQVVWQVSGSISTQGLTQEYSFPTLSAGPVTLSTCGPAGTVFDVSLLSATKTTLASATANSNCQNLTYTPASRDLFLLKEKAMSGTGAWSGTITTQ